MEAEYRELFDANPRPTWVFDRETLVFLEVNRAACELYGWTRDELLAMTLREIRLPKDMKYFEDTFASAPRDVASFSRVGRHVTKAGREIEVDLALTRLTFRGHSATLAIVTDVTGVDDAKRRFRLLVEHSADGISVMDETGAVQYMSPGAERLLGLAPGELIGKSSQTITHPEDPPREAPIPGETRTYLRRVRHKNGSWRWIESLVTNLTHDPAVRAHVANFRDITDRHQAEEIVRRSEVNFRTLIERSPTATFIHRDGRYIYVNAAAVALLGCDAAAEIVGSEVLSFVHPDDRDLIAKRMQQTATMGNGPSTETRMLRRDGSTVIMDAEGVLLDFDGQPSHVVLARDVTQQRELFARLALADRMLSVGTLAAGVAHEINNPLAYVVTNLALLDEELPKLLAGQATRLRPDEIASVLGDAREGTERVGAIVRDLRSLARPEHDPPGPVDVIAVLASSIKMAANEIRHRARVVESYVPAPPRVSANASRLGQVFLNLLVNAAHAIEIGHADINEVRVRVRAEGHEVIVEIEDTGAGMPANVLSRIFDPFFTTKPPGVGIGLGLSICHQIVESIGGSIAVSSSVGKGSTFRVRLPSAVVTETVSDAPSVVLPSRARILLIDDEAAVGRSIRILLAPEHDVMAVTRAKDALAKLVAGEHFDVILCDLMMPEMTGIELYEQLASIVPEYLDRVVFMTGGAFTEHAREFLAASRVPQLEKPFSEPALRRAIASVRG